MHRTGVPYGDLRWIVLLPVLHDNEDLRFSLKQFDYRPTNLIPVVLNCHAFVYVQQPVRRLIYYVSFSQRFVI